MIMRIFRIDVHREYISEFEMDYKKISIPLVKSQKGIISVKTGKPISKENTEYIMITCWENLEYLKSFIGKSWSKALIPTGMEKYVKNCWVHHYENDE